MSSLSGGQVPGVIDRTLLNKKAAEQGLRLEQLQNISLNSLNILKIDHLWIFKQLTVLRLNENIIEKIENLDNLTCLTELNLSFNRITTIENLERLVRLEKLLLHCNCITKLEGLDQLQQLRLLSISDNQLHTLDDVIYLRRLKNLRALSLEHNPLCSTENYKTFIIAFLPNLRFYDHKLINRTSEQDFHYRQQLARLQEEEEEVAQREQQACEAACRQAILQEAFVDTLDVGEMLASLEKPRWAAVMQMGADALTSIQNEHKEQVEKVCKELQELGLRQLDKRKEELADLRACLKQAAETNRQESMRCVGDFLAPKEEMYRNIRRILVAMEQRKASNEDCGGELDKLKDIVFHFNKEVEGMWQQLMVLELELQEQMEEVTGEFEVNMAGLVDDFIEQAQTLLLQAKDLEEQFHARVEDPCQLKAANTRLQIKDGEDKPILGKAAMQLVGDPAVLRDCLCECHEERLQAITQREQQLESACHSWRQSLVKQLNMEAFQRSRCRILEINNFLDMQRKEISDLQPTSMACIGLL